MIRAFQWDLARQVERLDWLLAQLHKYSKCGYNELHLHFEDAVDYPSLPRVARRDAYSWRQFQRLVGPPPAPLTSKSYPSSTCSDTRNT